MPPIDERVIHEVVQLHHEGMTWRAIARALHISRNTVRQILADHGEARVTLHSALSAPTHLQRPSKLNAWSWLCSK